jgi:hypothetical protein
MACSWSCFRYQAARLYPYAEKLCTFVLTFLGVIYAWMDVYGAMHSPKELEQIRVPVLLGAAAFQTFFFLVLVITGGILACRYAVGWTGAAMLRGVLLLELPARQESAAQQPDTEPEESRRVIMDLQLVFMMCAAPGAVIICMVLPTTSCLAPPRCASTTAATGSAFWLSSTWCSLGSPRQWKRSPWSTRSAPEALR